MDEEAWSCSESEASKRHRSYKNTTTLQQTEEELKDKGQKVPEDKGNSRSLLQTNSQQYDTENTSSDDDPEVENLLLTPTGNLTVGQEDGNQVNQKVQGNASAKKSLPPHDKEKERDRAPRRRRVARRGSSSNPSTQTVPSTQHLEPQLNSEHVSSHKTGPPASSPSVSHHNPDLTKLSQEIRSLTPEEKTNSFREDLVQSNVELSRFAAMFLPESKPLSENLETSINLVTQLMNLNHSVIQENGSEKTEAAMNTMFALMKVFRHYVKVYETLTMKKIQIGLQIMKRKQEQRHVSNHHPKTSASGCPTQLKSASQQVQQQTTIQTSPQKKTSQKSKPKECVDSTQAIHANGPAAIKPLNKRTNQGMQNVVDEDNNVIPPKRNHHQNAGSLSSANVDVVHSSTALKGGGTEPKRKGLEQDPHEHSKDPNENPNEESRGESGVVGQLNTSGQDTTQIIPDIFWSTPLSSSLMYQAILEANESRPSDPQPNFQSSLSLPATLSQSSTQETSWGCRLM